MTTSFLEISIEVLEVSTKAGELQNLPRELLKKGSAVAVAVSVPFCRSKSV
jgi:hypothetical protein